MSDYQENGDNLKSLEENARWDLDTTKLSKDDLEVLKIVHFPASLGYNGCAQKRIKKRQHNETYAVKDKIAIDDIVYLPIGKKIAWYQINQDMPRGNTAAELKQSQTHINKIHYNRPLMHLYIDAHYMEKELEWLLSNFSAPKPTPSMKKEIAEKIEAPVKEEKKKGGKPKATLSDREMAKAGQLYAEGKSAKDIAKDLGKPKVTVLTYLKTLSKI